MNDVYEGDCREVRTILADDSIDTIITDPPYGLEFMGKGWDKGVPGVEFWKEFLAVTKPGGMLLAFGGTRTFHRMTVAIEDAGWEIRDCMMWLYGSGFPKSLDISKAIDRAKGEKRKVVSQTQSGGFKTQMKTNLNQGFRPDDYYPDGNKFTSKEAISEEAKHWNGWGTALKPAWEPIIVAMKPLDGTFANNAEKHAVAGINVDGGRIGIDASDDIYAKNLHTQNRGKDGGWCTNGSTGSRYSVPQGRWPANLILDEEAGKLLDMQQEAVARFFYCAKASKSERNKGCEALPLDSVGDDRENPADNAYQRGKTLRANTHPTVKPLKLMEYLCTLTKTPPGGIVLDPFAGSGTTLLAAKNTGRGYVGIEQNTEYVEIIKARLGVA